MRRGSNMNQDGGLLPLPLGEGWGEGLRSFLMSSAPSPAALRWATSPRRGEVSCSARISAQPKIILPCLRDLIFREQTPPGSDPIPLHRAAGDGGGGHHQLCRRSIADLQAGAPVYADVFGGQPPPGRWSNPQPGVRHSLYGDVACDAFSPERRRSRTRRQIAETGVERLKLARTGLCARRRVGAASEPRDLGSRRLDL